MEKAPIFARFQPAIRGFIQPEIDINADIDALNAATILNESSIVEDPEGSVLIRERITNPAEWPQCTNGRVMAFDQRKILSSEGSGTMIGPNFVLTCAHVVVDNDSQPFHEVRFLPGAHKDKKYFGELVAAKVIVHPKYRYPKDDDEKNWRYDIALLVLDIPIGNLTGWLGLGLIAENRLFSVNITSYGYPEDKVDRMYKISANNADIIYKEGLMLFRSKTVPGQSGSGIIYSPSDNMDYLIGVIACIAEDYTTIGSFIDADKYNFLVDAMRTHSKENNRRGNYPFDKLTSIMDWKTVKFSKDWDNPITILKLEALPTRVPETLILEDISDILAEMLSVYIPAGIKQLELRGKISLTAFENICEGLAKRFGASNSSLPELHLKAFIYVLKPDEDPKSGKKGIGPFFATTPTTMKEAAVGDEIAKKLPIIRIKKLYIDDAFHVSNKEAFLSWIPATYSRIYIKKEPMDTTIQLKEYDYQSQRNWPVYSEIMMLSLSLKDVDMQRILATSFGVEVLNLENSAINDQKAKILANKLWPNLRSLVLNNNDLTDKGIEILAAQRWPKLTRLELIKNKLSKESIKHIAKGKWPLLCELSLLLSHEMAVEFASYKWPILSELNILSDGTLDLEELSQIEFPNLISLKLYRVGLDDEQLLKLKPEKIPYLTKLNLKGNKITDAGLIQFASKNWENLSALSLAQNKITDEGIEALVDDEKFTNLTSLDLEGNGIGNDGIQALRNSKLRNLIELRIAKNKFDIDAVYPLIKREKLPSIISLTY